ncbi:hypothetical protein MIDIC_410007 [Alphaproteobacteria bacterium]
MSERNGVDGFCPVWVDISSVGVVLFLRRSSAVSRENIVFKNEIYKSNGKNKR